MEWPSVGLMWRMEVCETFGKEKPKFRVVSLCFSGVVKQPIQSRVAIVRILNWS